MIRVKSTDLTLELVMRLLPDEEELQGLRSAVMDASIPDPALAWSRSSDLATLDKRVLNANLIDTAIEEAEREHEAFGRRLFAGYRVLLHAFQDGRPDEVVRQLVGLAERKEEQGQFASARRYLEVALTVAEPLPAPAPRVLALQRLGRVSRAAGELDDSLRHYERCAGLARDAGDVHAFVTALVGAGTALALQGKWTEAEREHLTALEEIEGGEDERTLRGQVYNNLGYLTARQGRLAEADGWLQRANAIWEAEPSPADLAVYHHCCALVSKERGERAEARRHYLAALDLPIATPTRAGVSIDLAEVCLEMGEQNEAEHWGRVAEEHAIRSRSPYLLGRVYQVRGNVAREAGDEDGFIFYEKALEIARDRELTLLEGETLLDYSGLRGRMGEHDEARSYLDRAREIFAAVGASAELVRADELSGEMTADASGAGSGGSRPG